MLIERPDVNGSERDLKLYARFGNSSGLNTSSIYQDGYLDCRGSQVSGWTGSTSNKMLFLQGHRKGWFDLTIFDFNLAKDSWGHCLSNGWWKNSGSYGDYAKQQINQFHSSSATAWDRFGMGIHEADQGAATYTYRILGANY